jgi:hypothetical protein
MTYNDQVFKELAAWQKKMAGSPTLFDRVSKRVQTKVNSYIPEKVHKVITATIKQMVKGVLFGATYTTKEKVELKALLDTEEAVKRTINTYKNTAAAEGGITGAGGLLLAFADFPILLGIKIKMLFDIAVLYGYSVKDYKERVYILHIFQLAFSSQQQRRIVYEQMKDWDEKKALLPDDVNAFDWRQFQQEYRDYIDLAKMAQLIPGIGAVVGFLVNYRLINTLGITAMNAYRMRLQKDLARLEGLK